MTGRGSFSGHGSLAAGARIAGKYLVTRRIGAGGRSVIASHWPVPDDYDATERLISGLFALPPGTATAPRRSCVANLDQSFSLPEQSLISMV